MFVMVDGLEFTSCIYGRSFFILCMNTSVDIFETSIGVSATIEIIKMKSPTFSGSDPFKLFV
jgi:hypothetical protein